MNFLDKNNFSLFKFRPEALNLSPMEEEYGVKLPPLYKLFLEIYSDGAHLGTTYYYDESPMHSFARIDYYSLDDKSRYRGTYAFESFYSPKDMFKMYTELKGEWIDDEGYMYIAEHGWGTGFAVGIKEHNMDKIFYIPNAQEAFLLEENIFRFISKFEVIDESDELAVFDFNKLYKNYGEVSWRLKKDEENLK